jgi:hypothetical protein
MFSAEVFEMINTESEDQQFLDEFIKFVELLNLFYKIKVKKEHYNFDDALSWPLFS